MPLGDSAPMAQNFTKLDTPMLRSTPPVMATSNSCAARPSIVASIAAIAEAHAASTVKFGPWRLKRLAMRPAMQLASSPGIVSSVISGRQGFEVAAQLAVDGGPHVGGQRGEAPGLLELAGELGVGDAQVGQVVPLARHRRAEDHRGAIEVERALRPARVGERHARARHGPLLAVVHAVGDLGGIGSFQASGFQSQSRTQPPIFE